MHSLLYCGHVLIFLCNCVQNSQTARGGPPGLGGATHYQTQGLGALEVPEPVSTAECHGGCGHVIDQCGHVIAVRGHVIDE